MRRVLGVDINHASPTQRVEMGQVALGHSRECTQQEHGLADV
jgi:hypothetical protein